jgi:hypothetical protein
MPIVSRPRVVSYRKIIETGSCLAPSRYADTIGFRNVTYRKLADVVHASSQRERVNPQSTYDYIEISDIDVYSGMVESKPTFGVDLPSLSPMQVNDRDVLLSTVRTYRNGVGIVALSSSNRIVCSPALVVIRGLEQPYTKGWMFAFLRSKYFLHQISALQNRGVYPRLDIEALQHILIPVPSVRAAQDADRLVEALILVRGALKEAFAKQNAIISNELGQGSAKTYVHRSASYSSIFKAGRIDAGFYSARVGLVLHQIESYRHGSSDVESLGYDLLRGQNLQKTAIGESIYSDSPHPNFYRLIRPTNFSEFGIVDAVEYLGNKGQLSVLQYGDIVFSAEGNVGKCIVIDTTLEGSITNIHGIVLRPRRKTNSFKESSFVAAVLRYFRSAGVFMHLAVGGQGGSFASQYWSLVSIPNMPSSVRDVISDVYSNGKVQAMSPDSFATMAGFERYIQRAVRDAGVIQLQRIAGYISEALMSSVTRICEGMVAAQ